MYKVDRLTTEGGKGTVDKSASPTDTVDDEDDKPMKTVVDDYEAAPTVETVDDEAFEDSVATEENENDNFVG